MMNLENTKVYSKEEDVIKKIQKITGLDIHRDVLIHDDNFGCLVIRDYAICIALKNSPTELDDVNYQVVTPEQIKALYAEKFGIKTETQEEREALDAIAQVDSEEWNGEGLPPVGSECEFKLHNKGDEYFSYCFIIGTRRGAQTKSDLWLVFSDKYDNLRQHHCEQGVFVFRKPETPQQREERERLESAYDLYLIYKSASNSSVVGFADFKEDADSDSVIGMLAIVDKTGYRKQSK